MRGVDERSDRDLLAAMAAGDRGAEEAFVVRHAAWAVAFAAKRGADEYAEDVAQSVLGNLVERPVRGLRNSSARGYLGRCLVREMQRVKLAEKRAETQALESGMLDPATSLSRATARKQSVGLVLDEVAQLSEPKQEMFLARYRDGLEPTEIATVTHRPAVSVRQDLHQIIRRLRSNFSTVLS